MEANAIVSPSETPDRTVFAATADSQIDSPFFTLLPPEIRQLIYVEFWRNDGPGSLRQHITWKKGCLTRVPCVTDPLAKDVRYTEFNNSDPGSDERSAWLCRLLTSWALHWACEEAHLARTTVPKSSFLPVLLSCKRMQVNLLCEEVGCPRRLTPLSGTWSPCQQSTTM
jgi:hypothetical protein